MFKEEYHKLVIVLFLIVLIIFALSGCKTIKTTNSEKLKIEQESDVKESNSSNAILEDKSSENTKEILTQSKDSSVSDNTKESSSVKVDNSIINFGDGGGTYNTNTGEASNVISVQISKQEQELKREYNKQLKINEELNKQVNEFRQNDIKKESTIEQLKDSNGVLNMKLNAKSTTTESVKNNWYWWLLAGLTIGVVGYFLISKYLKTNPIARFIKSWIK